MRVVYSIFPCRRSQGPCWVRTGLTDLSPTAYSPARHDDVITITRVVFLRWRPLPFSTSECLRTEYYVVFPLSTSSLLNVSLSENVTDLLYYYSIIVNIKFRRISFPENCVVVFDFVPTTHSHPHPHTYTLLFTSFDRFTPSHPLFQLFVKCATIVVRLANRHNIIIVVTTYT